MKEMRWKERKKRVKEASGIRKEGRKQKKERNRVSVMQRLSWGSCYVVMV